MVLRGSSRVVACVAALAAALLGLTLLTGPAQARAPRGLPTWRLVDTGTSLHFRGLAVVSKKVVWLGGYDGTVLRTLDGGASWQNVSPAGASALQFRDISAFNRNDAVAMAAGTGTDSRLYMTSDGGRTWELAYENTDPAAFFDCMSFYNPRHGLVLSDPVDGKFRVLATDNGGATWTVLPNQGMPPALDGEAGFAASGECLTTVGRDAWFGSGGASAARIFHSGDGGLTWNVQTAPVESGPTAGVFGLAFDRRGRGIAVGGDFAAPTAHDNVAAYSRFGAAWRSAATQPGGYRSGVTFLPPQSGQQTAVAVGLTGSDVTYDAGRHWTTFDTGQFDTVMCGHSGSCWASGDLGRVAILQR